MRRRAPSFDSREAAAKGRDARSPAGAAEGAGTARATSGVAARLRELEIRPSRRLGQNFLIGVLERRPRERVDAPGLVPGRRLEHALGGVGLARLLRLLLARRVRVRDRRGVRHVRRGELLGQTRIHLRAGGQ
jgi:hypothetical protein